MMLISNQAAQVDDDYRDLVTNPVGNGINPIKYGDGVNDGSLRASPSIGANEDSCSFPIETMKEAKQRKAAGDGGQLQGGRKLERLAGVYCRLYAGLLFCQASRELVGKPSIVAKATGLDIRTLRFLRLGDIVMTDIDDLNKACGKLGWVLSMTATKTGNFSVSLDTGRKTFSFAEHCDFDIVTKGDRVSEIKENKRTTQEAPKPYQDYGGAKGLNYYGI